MPGTTTALRATESPELGKANARRAEQKAKLLDAVAKLPANVKTGLTQLVHWTARVLGAALVNPMAPNREWADSAETIRQLEALGIIGTKDATMVCVRPNASLRVVDQDTLRHRE